MTNQGNSSSFRGVVVNALAPLSTLPVPEFPWCSDQCPSSAEYTSVKRITTLYL